MLCAPSIVSTPLLLYSSQVLSWSSGDKQPFLGILTLWLYYLDVWCYFIHFSMLTDASSAVVMPFSQMFTACMGSGIDTNQMMKMVGGMIASGRPVANLYVCSWRMVVVFFFHWQQYPSLQCGAMTLLANLLHSQVISRLANTSRSLHVPCFSPSSGVLF